MDLDSYFCIQEQNLLGGRFEHTDSGMMCVGLLVRVR